jgi:chromosomal replication initiation ATPase DnaA
MELYTDSDMVKELELQQQSLLVDAELCGLLGAEKEEIDEILREAREISDQMTAIINKQSIEDVISRLYGIPKSEMFAKTRKREYVNARKLFVYCLRTIRRQRPEESQGHFDNRKALTSLGNYMSHKDHAFDHASVLHMYRKAKDHYDTEEDFRRNADLISVGVENKLISLPKINRLIQ